MNTLIVPCAGKSSRFPGMKPKYMLTYPDGKLMVEKAMEGLNCAIFDRIILTIVQPHDAEYEAKPILEQCFAGWKNLEICVLDDFTASAGETVYLTLTKMKVRGSVAIKDSDNYVGVELPRQLGNFVVGYDLHTHIDVKQVAGKSFLIVNEQGLLLDIIEKKIVSNIICLGVYAFQDSADFISHYCELLNKGISGEMYVSHVISYMLSKRKLVFTSYMADRYEDWGTLREWREAQDRFRTYFVDVDGVILKNSGRYGSINWGNNAIIMEDNVALLKRLQKDGAQIILTTSRTEEFRVDLERLLAGCGLVPRAILMGLHHSQRVLINDFAPTNPFPSSVAVSIPRNANLRDYLQ